MGSISKNFRIRRTKALRSSRVCKSSILGKNVYEKVKKIRVSRGSFISCINGIKGIDGGVNVNIYFVTEIGLEAVFDSTKKEKRMEQVSSVS